MITVVGLGPGSKDYLGVKALEAINSADEVIFRTLRHPVIEDLNLSEFKSFDYLYESVDDYDTLYRKMADILIEKEDKNIVYAVPGSPYVAETAVKHLFSDTKVNIINAPSFLDAITETLKLDISEGFIVQDALGSLKVVPEINSLFVQTYSRDIASKLKLELLKVYDDEVDVIILKACGTDLEEVHSKKLYDMDRYDIYDHLTSVFVAKNQKKRGAEISELISLMKFLRSPNGCPWDREQTHESLKKYLMEETYEVLEAIDSGDFDLLEEELGDLLLQIVFHSALAEEEGYFDLNDVIKRLIDKLVSRHSHIFGEDNAETSGDVRKIWDKNKSKEKNKNDKLKDIPKCSMLFYAQKVFELYGVESLEKAEEIDNLTRDLMNIVIRANREKIVMDGLINRYIKNKLIKITKKT